ncbi:hypothetical protein [Sphingomonas lenta]|nr:hypothetical protein [Sphingomonas lenta]
MIAAAPAAAQDDFWMNRFNDAAQAQQDLARTTMLNSTMRRSAQRRGAGPAVTSRQAAACAQKTRFHAEHGAGNSKVQRLYSLCRGVGL